MPDSSAKATWPTRHSEPADRRRQEAEWLYFDFAAARGSLKGKRVLDVDCGSGYLSFLAGKAGAAQVFGVTDSVRALAWANAEFAGGVVRFRERPCSSLPLASGDVELALSLETLERQRDALGFIAELYRVLAPGGLLVLSTRLTRGPQRLHPQDPLHVREYDDVELAALLSPRFSIAERLGLWREPGPLRTRPRGVRAAVDRTVGSVMTRLLGQKIAGVLAGPAPAPRGRLSADGWEDAPYQLVLCRRVG